MREEPDPGCTQVAAKGHGGQVKNLRFFLDDLLRQHIRNHDIEKGVIVPRNHLDKLDMI